MSEETESINNHKWKDHDLSTQTASLFMQVRLQNVNFVELFLIQYRLSWSPCCCVFLVGIDLACSCSILIQMVKVSANTEDPSDSSVELLSYISHCEEHQAQLKVLELCKVKCNKQRLFNIK